MSHPEDNELSESTFIDLLLQVSSICSATDNTTYAILEVKVALSNRA